MYGVSIRSDERDVAAYPSANKFAINLGETMQRVKEVKLGDIALLNGMTQTTVEEGRNDQISFSEGLRADTGETAVVVRIDDSTFPADVSIGFSDATPEDVARSGFPHNAPALFNNQLLIAQSESDGTYPPANNIILTLPPWLCEIRTTVSGDLTPTTEFETTGVAVLNGTVTADVAVPHGLGQYRSWKHAAEYSILSVCACTRQSVVFSDASDVSVPSSAVPLGCETRLSFTAAVIGYDAAAGTPDARLPTKLNATLQRRIAALQSSFIHAPALPADLLVDLLNHQLSFHTNHLNSYVFRFQQGQFQLEVVGGVNVHANGVSTAPRLFFASEDNATNAGFVGAMSCNKTSATDPVYGTTNSSLGRAMGFTSGQHPRTQRILYRRNDANSRISATLFRGGAYKTFDVTVRPGYYDAATFGVAYRDTLSWGFFDPTLSGNAPDSPAAEFAFVGSTGDIHNVVIRGGKYTPPTLASAIQYAMNRLDRRGVWNSSNNLTYGVPSVGDVYYVVAFEASVFTFTCREVASAPPITNSAGSCFNFCDDVLGAAVQFSVVFDTTRYVSVTASSVNSELIATYLGFTTTTYRSTRGVVTGATVRVPGMSTYLSQGLSNGVVAPLGSSGPATIAGYGAGPWKTTYPSYGYRVQGTTPTTKRYNLYVSTVQHTGDAGVPDACTTVNLTVSTFAGGIVDSVTIDQGGQNLLTGQVLRLRGGSEPALVLVATVDSGSFAATSLVVVSRGSGYTAGSVEADYVGPQGTTRIVHGDNTPSAHRLIVSRNVVEEGQPIGTAASGWPSPLSQQARSRLYRTTVAPFGYQVGDPVGFEDAYVLRTGSVDGDAASGGLTVDVLAVTGSVGNTMPSHRVGSALSVTVNSGGTGYVVGQFVATAAACTSTLTQGIGAEIAPAILCVSGVADATGTVNSVSLVDGGAGLAVQTSVACETVVGKYAARAVVVEVLDGGLALLGATTADMALAATMPVAPMQTSTAMAMAARAPDGATMRLRVSENMFYRADHPGNLASVQWVDRPGFEVITQGSDPFTWQRPGNACQILGIAGTQNLFGRAQYLAPHQWDLHSVPFLLLCIRGTTNTTDFNVYTYQNNQLPNLLAKLIVGSPISNVRIQLFDAGCGGYTNWSRVEVGLYNPDLTPFRLHGGELVLTLMFVCDSDDVRLSSV